MQSGWNGLSHYTLHAWFSLNLIKYTATPEYNKNGHLLFAILFFILHADTGKLEIAKNLKLEIMFVSQKQSVQNVAVCVFTMTLRNRKVILAPENFRHTHTHSGTLETFRTFTLSALFRLEGKLDLEI